ncbi:MAG: hypothetical protein RR549_00150 [Oscillospiraceae bacterium]
MKFFKKKIKNKKNTVEKSTIVFVTNQKRCVNLIEIGKKIAEKSETKLIVANISPTKLSADGAMALDYLFNQTTSSGGEMQIIYSNDFFNEMKSFVKKFNGLHIVTGRPENENSIVYRIQRELSEQIFYTVDPETEEYIAKNEEQVIFNEKINV